MVSLTWLPLLASAKESVPAVCICDANVSLDGSRSERMTPWASLGPLFVTVMVYVIGVPATMVLGAAFVTCRSADVVLTVSVALDALLLGLGSVLALLLAVAVLMTCVPLGRLALSVAVTVKVTELPTGRRKMVSAI